MNPSLSWNSKTTIVNVTVPFGITKCVQSPSLRRSQSLQKVLFKNAPKRQKHSQQPLKEVFLLQPQYNEATACMNRIKCYNSFSPHIIIDKIAFETAVGVMILYPKVTRTEKVYH